MKRYEVEVTVTVLLGDNSDEETAYDEIASLMSRMPALLATRFPWTWNMLDGCVTEVSV